MAYTNYNAPIIDIDTKNMSAIKVYKLLRDLGIKNAGFILALYDRVLKHVNPFSNTLTDEQKKRIHAEIIRNPWYFFREIVRMEVPGGLTNFQFHRGNVAILWCLLNNVNIYVELPRQHTKTGSIASVMAYNFLFRSTNTKASMMSKDPESVKNNLRDIVTIIQHLPPYLNIMDRSKDSINKEYIEVKSSGNSIITRPPANNPDGAQKKARGSREPVQWYDEIPFIDYIGDIYKASSNSWWQAAQFAKKNGAPYFRAFSSTPGILGTEKGDFIYYEFLPGCGQFDEKLFYDLTDQEVIHDKVREISSNDFVYIKMSYRQCGKGEEYFREMCRILNNDRESIDREVLLKWSRKKSDCPFSKEQLDRIQLSVRAPIGTIIIQNCYILKFYEKPDYRKKYIISVDCSGMLDRDYSAITVTDPQTFAPIATLRSNSRTVYSNTNTFANAIADVAINIFKKALIVIEKNNMGIALIDNILDNHPELTDRMYSSYLEPSAKGMNENASIRDTAADANVNRYSDKVIVYGFDTSNVRRYQMFNDILGVVVNELYDVIYDNDIFNEINDIVWRDGRLDHRIKNHDDMLFSYLIGLWVLCFSRILITRYNYPIGYIRPMSILDEPEPLTSKDFNESMIASTIIDSIKKDEAEKRKIELEMQIANRQIAGDVSRINIFDKSDKSYFNIPVADMNSMSLADAADWMFGDSGSIFDEVDGHGDAGGPEIETENMAEDIFDKTSQMDKATRDKYEADIQKGIDMEIMRKKERLRSHSDSSRNLEDRRRLEIMLREGNGHFDEKRIESLVNSFFSN